MPSPSQLPVSVVMPAYGHADYILQALESLLGQDMVPREVIVVNDGSPDDTDARLAPLVREGRIRYLSQPNAGMAAARNAGAALATSKYIYFLDDDDLAFPNALSTLIGELERHPYAGMVCGEAVVFSGEAPTAPVMDGETWTAERSRFLQFNQVGSPGQVLIRRSAFEEIGGFDTGIWGTDDWDLWLRLMERRPARWVRQPALAYRLHGANISRNVARMYNSSLFVARRHTQQLPHDERAAIRSATYRALRSFHTPRLRQMLRRSAARGEWGLAASAGRAWLSAWTADAVASMLLKTQLMARGRWRLPINPRTA